MSEDPEECFRDELFEGKDIVEKVTQLFEEVTDLRKKIKVLERRKPVIYGNIGGRK